MKIPRRLRGWVWLAAGWAVGAGSIGMGRKSSELGSQHTGPTIERIRALSELVTTRVEVADVQETMLQGRVGSLKAVLLVKGDVLLGVDLSAAKFESIDEIRHTAVLVLPSPTVKSPRLDHERTKLFALSEAGLWRVTPGDAKADAELINRAHRDAQRYITAVAADPSLIDRSRRQAENVLTTFFKAVGWTVNVRWSSG